VSSVALFFQPFALPTAFFKMARFDWEGHRDEIRTLWLDEGKTLPEMRAIFQQRGFTPSYAALNIIHGGTAARPSDPCLTDSPTRKATWERKLENWGFKKYDMGAKAWQSIAHSLAKREMDGRKREVYKDGKLIPPKRIRKETKRYAVKKDASATGEQHSTVGGRDGVQLAQAVGRRSLTVW
jgi:hypothetical protein